MSVAIFRAGAEAFLAPTIATQGALASAIDPITVSTGGGASSAASPFG